MPFVKSFNSAFPHPGEVALHEIYNSCIKVRHILPTHAFRYVNRYVVVTLVARFWLKGGDRLDHHRRRYN